MVSATWHDLWTRMQKASAPHPVLLNGEMAPGLASVQLTHLLPKHKCAASYPADSAGVWESRVQHGTVHSAHRTPAGRRQAVIDGAEVCVAGGMMED